MSKIARNETTKEVLTIHPVDEILPPNRLALYGFQHVMTFYAGALLNPLLIATGVGLPPEDLVFLITANLFMAGIASLMQANGFWKVGIRMPVVQGITTTCVGPAIAICLAHGGGITSLPVLFGAIIVSGLIAFLIAPYFSRIIRFFPPLVTGSVVTVVGIYLLPIAALKAGGGDPRAPDFGSLQNLAMAFGTLAFILVIYWRFRGFITTIAILIGLVAGTTVAAVFGLTNFSAVGKASWMDFPAPFYYGMPQFDPTAIFIMTIVMLIVMVESAGQYFAVAKTVGKKIGPEDIAAGIRADTLATAIGGAFNSFPTTIYSQNVGLLRLSGIKSRWVITAAGIMMIILSLLPKVGAIISAVPTAVLGGAMLVLFGSIAITGIQILAEADLSDTKNLIVAATSLAMCIISSNFPEFYQHLPSQELQLILGNGIIMGTVTAVVLNILFNHIGKALNAKTL